MSHEEIVEHVSSLLTSKGIVYSGKGIDTGNLEWFGINWDHLYSFIYFMHTWCGFCFSKFLPCCLEATNMGQCRSICQGQRAVCYNFVWYYLLLKLQKNISCATLLCFHPLQSCRIWWMHLFSTLQYQKGATSLRTINYASHYFISWFLTNFIAEIGDCEKTNETDKSSSKLRMVRRYLMKFKLMISPFCMSIANGSVHGQLLCDFFFQNCNTLVAGG